MPNYKEQVIPGEITKWVRASAIQITNRYETTPTINFGEEEITLLPDGQHIARGMCSVTADFSDPTKVFPLLNPETDEVIGSAAYQEIYVILYSLYMSLAKARDIAAG